MNDLIEALGILKKYLKDRNRKYPTVCEHDVLMVIGIDFSRMTVEDAKRLDTLGFILGTEWDKIDEDVMNVDNNSSDEDWKKALDYASHNLEGMSSFRFGSC